MTDLHNFAHKNVKNGAVDPADVRPKRVSIDVFCAKIHADMDKTPPPPVQLGIFFDSFPGGGHG